MFSDEELNAFYAGKKSGYENKEYTNAHLEFLSSIEGAVSTENIERQFNRGFAWGKAQKDEEQS